MGKGISRHELAVAALELVGHEHVLEIGCGHGLAVRLVLERLTSGTITALDRSAKMIDPVRASIQDPRLFTCAQALENAQFGSRRFDAILAVNPDFNLRFADRWPAMLKALLQPDARIVLLMEAPAGSGKAALFASQSLRVLSDAGFDAHQLPAPHEMAIIRASLPRNGVSPRVS